MDEKGNLFLRFSKDFKVLESGEKNQAEMIQMILLI